MEEEGIEDNGSSQARTMLELFSSVGATRFYVTWTNLDGEPRRARSLRKTLQALGCKMPKTENEDWLDAVHIAGISVDDFIGALPAILETAKLDRLNVHIRPVGTDRTFIQLDDLSSEKLVRVPPVFLQLETSPGNFQAWLALPGSVERYFASRLKLGTGADVNASGSTRIAGSLNLKEKHAPDFPRVAIHAAYPGRFTSVDELEGLGLVAPPVKIPPAPRKAPARSTFERERTWPSYAKCLERAPLNSAGKGPDTSRADIAFCMIAIDWGFGVEETARRLREEPESKAFRRDNRYALDTARKAELYVRQRQLKSNRR